MVATTQVLSYQALLERDGVPPEIEQLARITTACELLDESEAVIDEFDARSEAIRDRLKPGSDAEAEPFAQRSSIGAYLLARYAVAWVPDGLATRRHAPFGPERLVEVLTESALPRSRAEALLGDWSGGGDAPPSGRRELAVGWIAGVAERSLTRAERDEALRSVAWSPRDQARLVASARLVDRVRSALPWALGRPTACAIVAADVPFRMPDRRARLLSTVDDPIGRLLADLARLEDALRRDDEADLAELRREWAEHAASEADAAALGSLSKGRVQLDERHGACLGLRPRREGLHPLSLLPRDDPRLEALVRGIAARALSSAEAVEPAPTGAEAWDRRLLGLALGAAGRLDEAQTRLTTADPEHGWVRGLSVRRWDAVPGAASRRQAADFVRDLTASVLLASRETDDEVTA